MIPIPERMKHLPLDRRGYPVPYPVMFDDAGVPHFAINDEHKRGRVIRNDLCSICGMPLFRGRWFVGGCKSAFHPEGAYIDPPMHHDCSLFAMQVCPYLAAPHYGREIGMTKYANSAQTTGVAITIDPTMIEGRPSVFVRLMCIGNRMTENDYIKPNRPYRHVEFWINGQQIDDAEGWQIVANDLEVSVTTARRLSNKGEW